MSMSYSGFKIPMTADRADEIMPMLRILKYVLAVRHVGKGDEGQVHVAFDRLVSEETWDDHFFPLLSALLADCARDIEPVEWDPYFYAGTPVDLELYKYLNKLKSQADADMQDADEWAHRQRQLAKASRLLIKAFDPERHDRLYGPRP